jgi:hypothetical protein
MNKYIYKVIKWLENPESVSQKERDKNAYDAAYAAAYAAADTAYAAAYAAYDSYAAADAAYDAAYDAADAAYASADTAYAAAYASAYAAAENNPEIANHFIDRYFEITGENKQDYLDRIEAEK